MWDRDVRKGCGKGRSFKGHLGVRDGGVIFKFGEGREIGTFVNGVIDVV